MSKPEFIYDIDEHPPLQYALLYGLQWAVIMFPTLIIAASLSGTALGMDAAQEVRFLQLTLLTSGLFTAVQSLWGHRYPLLDGPATALLLTCIVLAPYGIASIQGGTMLGGALLVGVVAFGKLHRIRRFITPNVVGVILMLIALSLLPHLTRSMLGADPANPNGRVSVFLLSIGLVLLIAVLSHWLRGFWKTVSLLLGMLLGTLLFALQGSLDWEKLSLARWISVPHPWAPAHPAFYLPAMAAFASSYVAVMVNSLGSIHGIANVTDTGRLPSAMSRGILITGVAGLLCGIGGLVGTVSYSVSPGVVLANRVASRYATFYCGLLLVLAACVPKLSALLALVPGPVVAAALCAAMGTQVGAALAIISAAGMTARDYFVVGLPILLGALVGFLPEGFMACLPAGSRVFLGNGLIVGIFLVLLLEHVLMRRTTTPAAP